MQAFAEIKFTARIPAELNVWLAERALRNDRSQNRELVSLIRAAKLLEEAKESHV